MQKGATIFPFASQITTVRFGSVAASHDSTTSTAAIGAKAVAHQRFLNAAKLNVCFHQERTFIRSRFLCFDRPQTARSGHRAIRESVFYFQSTYAPPVSILVGSTKLLVGKYKPRHLKPGFRGPGFGQLRLARSNWSKTESNLAQICANTDFKDSSHVFVFAQNWNKNGNFSVHRKRR